MRASIKRVSRAAVATKYDSASAILRGLCVEIGFHKDDTMEDINFVVNKILNVKFFSTCKKNLKRSVREEDLEILCVQRADLFPAFGGNRTAAPKGMSAEKSKEFHAMFIEVLQRNYDDRRIVDGEFNILEDVEIEMGGSPTATLDSRS